MAKILGGYGPLSVVLLDDGRIALDFTGPDSDHGGRGTYVTLNAMQWTYLQRVVRSLPARPR